MASKEEELKELAELEELAQLEALAAQEAPKKEPSLKQRALEGTLQALNYVGGLGRGGVAAALEPVVGKDLVSPEEIMTGRVPGSSELMARAGVPEGYSLSDIVPGAFSQTGQGLPLQKGGMFDITARGVGGLVGDIALDPTTYVLPMVKGAGMAAKGARVALNPLGEAFTAGVKGAGKIGTAIAGKFSQFTPEEATQYLTNPEAVSEATRLLGDKTSLDIAQEKAFQAVSKMRDTLKKAGLAADREMGEILEGKNVQVNLNRIKQMAEDLPGKQKGQVDAIVSRAEKDLEAYRPFEPEFLSTTAEQRGVSGLEFPEVKTQAEMRPPSVVQEVEIQPDLFAPQTVTKVEPGLTSPQVRQLGAGGSEVIPATMIPSEAVDETLQMALFPEVRSAQLRGGITPPELVRAGRSEYFPTETSRFSELLQEPLPLPARGTRPEAATIPAPLARRLKQIFQEEAKYGKSAPVTAKGTPRYTEYADVANELNQELRKEAQVQALDDFMRQGIVAQQALEQGEKAPLQFLKTQSEDVTAMLARAARRTGDKEVFDLANQLSAARKIIGKGDYDDWVSRNITRIAGRQSLKAIDKFARTGKATQGMINAVIGDPNVPPQIWLEMLRKKESEK